MGELKCVKVSGKGLYDQVREVRLAAFPELRGTEADTEAFFRWKFQTRPAHLFVAELDGRVVGFYAGIEHRYQAAGRVARVALVVDVLTDPRVRKQGVFTRLGRASLQGFEEAGIDFAFGYPIRPEVMPGHLKVGWKVSVELPVYVAPVQCSGLFSNLLPDSLGKPFSRSLEEAAALGARLLTRTVGTGSSLAAGSLELWTTEQLVDHPDFPELLVRWQKGQPLVLAEDVEFYRWRYSAPGRTFRHLVAIRGGRLQLVISTRVMSLRGLPSLAIADVMQRDPGTAVPRQAWHELWKLAWREDISMMAAMAPARFAWQAAFYKLPLLRTPLKFRLITRDLASCPPPSFEQSALKLMWTDTDDV